MKNPYDRLIYLISFISVPALFLEWWLAWKRKNCGLLSRRCCDQDRRASFICLTDEGQTTLAYLQKAVEERLGTSLDFIS